MQEYSFIVEKEFEGKRLDSFLSGELEDISRNMLQGLIEQGKVTVFEKKVNKSYKIKEGDIVLVSVPEPVEAQILPEDIPLDILFEDNDVIVINKPQGMVVHPAPSHYSGTVVNAVMFHCGENLSGINGVLRPGIVHRIDKDTSGIIVIAKNDMAHKALALQLANHSMERVYNAICVGNFKEDSGTIDKPIARSPKDRKKMAVASSGGRRAVTHYKVLEGYGKYSLVEFRLETGRTHQIRVHMASIGHSILGDKVYGGENQPFKLSNGQLLHAKRLGFIHPSSGEFVSFDSEPPQYFKDVLKKIKG